MRNKGVSEATKATIQQELEHEEQTLVESTLFLSTVADYSTPGEIAPERDRRHSGEDDSMGAGPSQVNLQVSI